jgi:hypothetical protein
LAIPVPFQVRVKQADSERNAGLHLINGKTMWKSIIVAWSAVAAASVAGAAIASASDGARERYRVRVRGAEAADADRRLPILDIGLCIEVPDGEITPGSRLVAGDCKDPTNGLDHTDIPETKSLVTLYSRKNSTMCMHAEPLAVGTFVRLRTCRDSNMYQAFYWWGNNIKPIGDMALCVAYHGENPEVGDYIKLKNCSDVATGWSFD